MLQVQLYLIVLYSLLKMNYLVLKEIKAFIGDLNYAIFFADRKQASVKWIENEIYGQVLATYMRFDVLKGVEEAGRFLTYTGTET